jgi:hypothetical protein
MQPEEMTDAVARLDASKLGLSSRIQLAHEAVSLSFQ